jgi:molybdenum cofactor biosynthesis enzyme MoaA
VLRTIDEALEVGFDNVKINCVIMKGINDHECVDFVELTRDKPLDVRFIEYMPFDGENTRKVVRKVRITNFKETDGIPSGLFRTATSCVPLRNSTQALQNYRTLIMTHQR